MAGSSYQTDIQTMGDALQARWDNASTDLNQILSDISQALDQAHQLYTQTEQSNASVWG